jgi:alpha-amylase
MTSVSLYLQVHQPHRLGTYDVFAVGERENYFTDGDDQKNNQKVLRKVSQKSYRPAVKSLLKMIKDHPEFRLTLSFSGVVLEQLQQFDETTLRLFQDLVGTGNVEILAETYHHSLAFFYDRDEFETQVEKHQELIQDTFGVQPKVFRNTELAYNNELGQWAAEAGYDGVLTEGWEDNLGWRSPNFVYRVPETDTALLCKNYKLSDDIAFRFSREDWESWPLSADTFAGWINQHETNADVINLFMDFETFGEHQWADTGIFEFLEDLPRAVRENGDDFMTVSETIESYRARDDLHIEDTVTWADKERDLTAWLGNSMQTSAIETLYGLKDDVLKNADDKLLSDWRRLQTSDHFYYMCTKWASDGDVHSYFSPYESPYDAYITYMNVLTDLKRRLGHKPTRL